MRKAFNYLEHFLLSVSAANGCASTDAFASLVDAFVCIARSTVGIKISAINVAIKKYKTVKRKKRKEVQSHRVISKI